MSHKQRTWTGTTAKEAMSQVPCWGTHCKIGRNTQKNLKEKGHALIAVQYSGVYKIEKRGVRDYVVTCA
jgi:hypothetical protein